MTELDVAISKVDERISIVQGELGNGVVHEYNNYLVMCGEIKGLLTARRELTDLKYNLENSDE